MNYTKLNYDPSVLIYVDKSKLDNFHRVANECYQRFKNKSVVSNESGKGENSTFCPTVFDGFLCWNQTQADTVLIQKCPDYIYGFKPTELAYKVCNANGDWYQNPVTKKEWTNYTACIDQADLSFRGIMNILSVCCYSLSTIALILAMFVFVYYKTQLGSNCLHVKRGLRNLKCPRVKIHQHFFTSFILNNIFWILWYMLIVNRTDIILENNVWCQIIHICTIYFMTTNYSWMFCEGFYLYFSIVIVFFDEEFIVRIIKIIGWGASSVIVAIYVVVRYNTPGATERCWIDSSSTFFIVTVPVIVSLMVSLVIMVKIIWVLYLKLQPTPNRHITDGYRKATKASSMLVIVFTVLPLLGLHFFLIPFRPADNTLFENAYEVILVLSVSLQGLAVTIIYCYTNKEVVSIIKKYVNRYRTSYDIPMTGITAADNIIYNV